MSKLSHFAADGSVKMVDVSKKQKSERRAVATARVCLSPSTLELLKTWQTPKGDPLEIARIAGIMAAKKTPELIPLCHQLNLTRVHLEIRYESGGVLITAEALASDRTGVEMEALTAASVAALTVYDMCKAVQKDIVITDIKLESKSK